MNTLDCRSIPHDEQRYDTVGDYFSGTTAEHFRISEMPAEVYEHLILIHELIEWIICQHRGISNRAIDNFDMDWKGEGEPGDDSDAPYYRAHQIASAVERLLAAELGVDWKLYEAAVEAVSRGE